MRLVLSNTIEAITILVSRSPNRIAALAASFEVAVTGARGSHHVNANRLRESSADGNHKRGPEPAPSDVPGWAAEGAASPGG